MMLQDIPLLVSSNTYNVILFNIPPILKLYNPECPQNLKEVYQSYVLVGCCVLGVYMSSL